MPTIPKKGLAEAVNLLRSFSPRLNSLTDLANETVRSVEEFLNDECSIGIPTVVQVYGSPDDPAGLYLEYRRVGPRFRIALVATDPEGNDTSVKPWADCPRSEKLQSFQKLPELLTDLADKVEKEIKETEATARTVSATLAALRKKPS